MSKNTKVSNKPDIVEAKIEQEKVPVFMVEKKPAYLQRVPGTGGPRTSKFSVIIDGEVKGTFSREEAYRAAIKYNHSKRLSETAEVRL